MERTTESKRRREQRRVRQERERERERQRERESDILLILGKVLAKRSWSRPTKRRQEDTAKNATR